VNAVRSACSRNVTRRSSPGSSGTRAKPASQRSGRTTWAAGSLRYSCKLEGQYSINVPAVRAGVLLSVLPLVILFVVMRRQVMRSLGSVAML